MKTPRDVSGDELAKLLGKHYGYSITRQSGSHARLTTMTNGEHHITIPAHSTLKAGTLNSILNDVALHFGLNKWDVIKVMFG